MRDPVTGSFEHGGFRLVYDEYGEGERTLVLLHGLLLNRHMHAPLARALAAEGNRVIALDLLGHGDSDRPVEMWHYAMPGFAEQVVALLDHLGVREAVVGGTSLGANVSLETAVLAPELLRGLVVEMPVLDNALLACALVFTPLLVGLTFGAPAARLLGRAAQAIPPGQGLADVVLDAVRQDPKPSASVLQGLFFDRIAPPRSVRRRIPTTSLVIGHPRDPVHPFSDADMLVHELAQVELVRARSLLELRVRPERLTGEITRFVAACWAAPASGPRRGRPRPASVARA